MDLLLHGTVHLVMDLAKHVMLEEPAIALLVLTKCYKVVFVKVLATHNSIQTL